MTGAAGWRPRRHRGCGRAVSVLVRRTPWTPPWAAYGSARPMAMQVEEGLMPVRAGWRRGRRASIVAGLVAAAAAAGLVAVATPASAATMWRNVSTGRDSTCGVKTDGSLWCWGDNTYGQLGLGDTTDRLVPTRVDKSLLWQDVT